MPRTVVLISATGLLGSQIFKLLSARHEKGEIKLIVAHRPSTQLDVPAGVETRPLEFNTATEEDVHRAAAGADIVINMTGKTDPPADVRFATYLGGVPSVKRYIPSDQSNNYSAAEIEASDSDVIRGKLNTVEASRKAGLPTTVIRNGVIEEVLLIPGLAGLDLAANTLTLYGKALENKLPVTSVRYITAAIVELALRPFEENEGYNLFTVIEYYTTGREIAQNFERVNGKPAKIVQWTEEDVQAEKDKGRLGLLGAALRTKWGTGTPVWTDGKEFAPTGVKPGSVERPVDAAARRLGQKQ